MKIKISNGLILDNQNNVIPARLADLIAHANELRFAERFVEKYEGQELILDKDKRIIHESCTDTEQG